MIMSLLSRLWLAHRFRFWVLTITGLVACSCLANSATAFTLTVDLAKTNMRTQAWASGGEGDLLTDAVDTWPYTQSTIAVSDRLNDLVMAESNFNFSGTGFTIATDQSRSGDNSSRTIQQVAIYFSVDDDVNFDAIGFYTETDSPASSPSPGLVRLLIGLSDETLGQQLFLSDQQSRYVSNESFTVGLLEGQYASSFEGSLSGTLIAGHEYYFQTYNRMQSWGGGYDKGATATGSISLSLSAIPEPNTCVLQTIALLGLTTMRRMA